MNIIAWIVLGAILVVVIVNMVMGRTRTGRGAV